MTPLFRRLLRYSTAPLLCVALVSCGKVTETALTSASQLYVTTIPPGAVVTCDGGVMHMSPATITGLAPGEHLVIARKEGHKEARFTASIGPGQRVALEMVLDPLCASAIVHTSPQGADVEINEVSRGKTPLLLTDLAMGKHRIQLRHAGFLPKTVELDIRDATPKKLSIALTSDSGLLAVATQPPGATLSIENVGTWQTPCNIPRIAVGTHRLNITRDGYQPYSAEITLSAGEQRSLSIPLTPMPSSISVDSIPEKALIFIDNNLAGEAPVKRHPVSAGTHAIRAELRGYFPASMTNSVSSGENASFVIRLEKNSGTVIVTTQPPGVKVFLDGEFSGETTSQPEAQISDQLIIDLVSEGQHELQFTKEGYFDVSKQVEIAINKTQILHQTLKKRPTPFVPNVIVRAGPSREQVYRGIIRDRYATGEIVVEIEPGIFRTFKVSEVTIERIGDAPKEEPQQQPPPQPPVQPQPKPAEPLPPAAPQPSPPAPAPAQQPAPEQPPAPKTPAPAPPAQPPVQTQPTPQPPPRAHPPAQPTQEPPKPAAEQPKPSPMPAPAPPVEKPPAPAPGGADPEIMTGTRPVADEY